MKMKTSHQKPVITPVFEKIDSLAGGQHQVNNNSSLSEIDQDDKK